MTLEERIIQKCHFDRSGFIDAVGRLSKKYENNTFSEKLKQYLGELIDIVTDPNDITLIKSDAYFRAVFMSENPSVDLKGINPFYVIRFSDPMRVDLIFILIQECRNNGILEKLVREKPQSTAIICPFDLFDYEQERSYSPKRK